MALIDCPECSNKISDKENFCPKCGYQANKISKPTNSPSMVNKKDNNSDKTTKKVSNSSCKLGFTMGILSLFFYEFWGITPIIAIIFSAKGLLNFNNKVHTKIV